MQPLGQKSSMDDLSFTSLNFDHKFRWYIGLFKKTFMDGTLKPSVLNGQRLDVEFKMAVNLGTVSGTMGELASSKYI